jgi:hypothetical protein
LPAKRAAARIGPTVCEEDGPIPILNKSKTLTAIYFRAREMPAFYAPRNDAMPLILYQRDDCPLCDEAYGLLAVTGIPDFEPVWIDGDAALEGRYGARVPVLRRSEDGAELDWPFTASSLRAFLSAPPAAAGS